jgi:hypothetical protein
MHGAGLLSQLSAQRNQMAMQPYEMLMNLANLNQNRYATALGTNTKAMIGKRPTFGQNFMSSFSSSLGDSLGNMFGPGGGGGGGATSGITSGSRMPFMSSNNLGAASMAAVG